ncbi:uncharacterized protein RCC_00223 [Ramularia collo-cygni]|uniref:Uncharacterized protein n=1 Tax=Ramularia collo-cygni TaxID=112498 RepID=A0A2D3UMS7_9PEZI|nr:uncharacterized protein RCC_00223 [Ramularia collo-cygni]CZT14248.1 uncharacterized protein RCC_00223 [Ramularia collo-cygni]
MSEQAPSFDAWRPRSHDPSRIVSVKYPIGFDRLFGTSKPSARLGPLRRTVRTLQVVRRRAAPELPMFHAHYRPTKAGGRANTALTCVSPGTAWAPTTTTLVSLCSYIQQESPSIPQMIVLGG